MADIFDAAKRSEVMSKIRSKNTKVEVIVFQYLRQQGVYFQKHYKRAIGNPDIALPRKKLAVFIDGDFWHGRKYQETIDRLPAGYWKEKIARNVSRDKKHRIELKESGWKILQVWESDIIKKTTRSTELHKIMSFLRS